jgi:hypothetical protein
MTAARGAVLAFLAVVLLMAIREGFRRDRVLGWMVSAAAAAYIVVALLMGLYLQQVRGRDYLAPDEVSFQREGERIVHAWKTGESHVPAVAGGYPTWNAAVIYFWGPSAVPMRLANAVAGVVGVLFAYILAWQLFSDRFSARAAAAFVMASPSLMVWGAQNLKERPLGVLVTMTLVAGVGVLERWSVTRVALFGGALVAVGELRHYYAAIIGWLALGLAGAWPGLHWRERIIRSATMLVVVGAALHVVTGSFLATGMRYETAMRYVRLQTSDRAVAAPGQGFRLGETSGSAVAAGARTPGEWVRAGAFVLLGRFEPDGGTGRVLAAALAPEWILSFALLPLAFVTLWTAVRDRRWLIALPAGFIGAMFLLLTYIHADPWTTVRFRSVYWPVFLVLAAGGAVTLLRARSPHAQSHQSFARAHD